MVRLLLLLLLGVAASVLGGPMKLYEKREGKSYEQVLVPVSSTVIPLDDLPEYKVGLRLGFAKPIPNHLKPEDIKLITIKDFLKKNLQKSKKFKKTKQDNIEEIHV